MTDASRLMQDLEASAAAGPDGWLALFDGGDAEVLSLSGIQRVFSFRLDSASLLQEIAAAMVETDPASVGSWMQVAAKASASGVRLRQQGDLRGAYHRYRFSLAVICTAGDPEGMSVVSANVYRFREVVRDAVERAIIPAEAPAAAPSAEWISQFREVCEGLLVSLRADAELLLPLALEAANAAPVSVEKTHALAAARRIAAFTGKAGERRRILVALHAAPAPPGNLQLIAVLEELAETQSPDLWLFDPMFGIQPRDFQPEQRHRGFEAVWKIYQELSACLGEAGCDMPLLEAYTNAFQHLDYLRFQITASGGPIAHVSSFAASRFFQAVGRGYIFVLNALRQGKLSLETAERVKARALGDMMSRTHYVEAARAPRQFRSLIARTSGNVQSMEPAGFGDIADAAKTLEAALLYFVKIGSEFAVWLIRPDGEMGCARIPIPDKLLETAFRALPYHKSASQLLDGRGFRNVRVVVGPQEATTDLNGTLSRLYERLLPPPIRAMLPPARSRLVILPDGPLDYLPFCALKAPDGRYLVQQHDILYLPSVTAWTATESDLDARTLLTERGGVIPYYMGGNLMIAAGRALIGQAEKLAAVYGPGSVVLGDPTLGPAYRLNGPAGRVAIELPDLPGALEEAREVSRILGNAGLYLHSDATLATLLQHGRSARVIHLAAHGVADAANPSESFLALADDPLTAADLYNTGFGFGLHSEIHAGLVMMSACQTGLGSFHPDSVIGLANGFLIAGANSVGSSLWRIDDNTTSKMMVRFYQLLAGPEGRPLSACLAESQLEVLKNPDTSDPMFWAAFKITGSDRNPLTV